MDTSPDFTAYEAKSSAFAALRAEIFPENKRMLFEVLASAGISTVVVEFDGCGDSGQIESVSGFTADNEEIALPSAPVEMREVIFDDLTISLVTRTPHEIIEAMAYDFLEQTHSGWEDGDGAFGQFTFAVADHSITLEFNERYVDSNYHQHEF
ncbi:conserved hypothetical protein [Burkholderiales bacterium]|nr:conserved hypothetical protein [Burkholderiales bacterium]